MHSFSYVCALVTVCAFLAGLAWTMACGLAIAICRHIELKLLARRLRLNADEQMRRASELRKAGPPKPAPAATPIARSRGGAC